MSRRQTQPPEPPSLSVVQQGNFGIPAAASKWNPTTRRPTVTPPSPPSTPHEPYHRYRNRSTWAQALILFNVLGHPLSTAPTLHHSFTTLYPTHTLLSLALIPSLQLLCLFAAPLPIGYLYRFTCTSPSPSPSPSRRGATFAWKLVLGAGMILATAAQFALYKAKSYIAVLLLRGPVLGLGLGTCFTVSSLVLAGHYRGDVPLVSVQSGFAGLAGALVYTVIANYQGVSTTTTTTTTTGGGGGGGDWTHISTGTITCATLLAAFFLLVRFEPRKTNLWTQRSTLPLCTPRHFFTDIKGGASWFLVGYMLVFTGILVYPVYSTTLLTHPPALFFPHKAAYSVLAMLSTAAVSGSAAANLRVLKRGGAVNLFVAAALMAGAVCLAPVAYPALEVAVLMAALYGVALGAVLVLHMLVAAAFLSRKVAGRWEDDMPARVAVGMALAGLSVFGGLVGAAGLIEGREAGGAVAMKGAGGCLIGGAVLVGCARLWRWNGVFYAV